jgi:hypothetical protein
MYSTTWTRDLLIETWVLEIVITTRPLSNFSKVRVGGKLVVGLSLL